MSLQWRLNGRDSASNHQPRECLLNRFIRCRSEKTSKHKIRTSPHKGPVTQKMFPFDDVIISYSEGAFGQFSLTCENYIASILHHDAIKWKHFLRHWPSDVELWFFSLICHWTNGWINHRDAGDLKRHCAHYDVTVMCKIRIASGVALFIKYLDISKGSWS